MQIEDIKMPSSREAEDYIVGCILIDSSIADEVLNSLTAADFYYPDNRTLMEVIEILADEQKDINSVTVINELNRISKLEMAGGYDHISEILNNIPSTANIDSYINVIQEASVERQLANACDKVRSDILKGKYVHRELMQNSERALFDIINGQNTDDFKKVNLLTDEVIEVIENNKENEGGLIGIDTGFEELNKITNGFKKSELIILAARPAVGKSAFALNVAAAACKTKKHVVLFSLEMGSGQLLMRMLASQSGVDLSRITSGNLDDEQMALILQAKVVLDKYQLYIDQSSTNNVRDIKAKCQKLHREGNLDLIIIDYLQLLVSGDKNVGNIVQEVTKISRALKQMAIQFGVPVLALSQLSRDIEKRPDKKPVLADLRDSGSIEQDADIVMFLYRENDKKEEDTSKIIQSAKTKLLVAKNRQGRTGEVNLMFKGKYSQFIEVDD
ncbi:MAG: replicative DNA helicase [Bacilli bacterium]|jgi:replicative DNA helicase|nr:replicative DNA helicase [Bacilli bacterium]